MAVLYIFENSVEFPEKFVVRKLFFRCFHLKCLQVLLSCNSKHLVLVCFLFLTKYLKCKVLLGLIHVDLPPILFPSSCSSASFTLLAQESKDSDRTFNRCSMANNSSRVYLYLQSEKITEKINAASGDQNNINIFYLKKHSMSHC